MAKVVHTIKGHEYLYEHYRVGKKVVSDYIGKVVDEIENVVSNTEKTIGEVTQQIEDDIVDTVKVIKLKGGRVVSVKVKHIPKIKHYGYKVSCGGIVVRFRGIDDSGMRERVLNSINRIDKKVRGLVETVNIHLDKGYGFTIGDKTFSSGGNWNVKEKVINVFGVGDSSRLERLDYVLSHEFGHSLYDKIKIDVRKELDNFMTLPETKKGFSKSAVSTLHEFYELSNEYKNSLSKKLDDFIEATNEEGGITSYSHSYIESKEITRYTENFAEAMRVYTSPNSIKMEFDDKIKIFQKTYKAFVELVSDYFEGVNTSLSLNPETLFKKQLR